jgi:hypothetical protein
MIKKVNGYECPKDYGHYDLTNETCKICEQAHQYQVCRYYKDRPACAGWQHPVLGPCSCKGYVQRQEDRKSFLHN